MSTLQNVTHLANDVSTAAALASRAQHTVPCCSRISGGYCADGHLVSRGAAAAHLQRRPDLMNRVSRLLQPGADLPSDAYYCILGAPNSGKTHIVRKACEEVRVAFRLTARKHPCTSVTHGSPEGPTLWRSGGLRLHVPNV